MSNLPAKNNELLFSRTLIMPEINPDRLMSDLRHLHTFGGFGTGLVRPALSPADMEARRWLCKRLGEAGLDVSIDGVGNVLGRSSNPGKGVLLGSHTDSQPQGGWLDGALGVIYGLEVARAFREDRSSSHFPIDVASWSDEEGSYLSMLGSLSFCGRLKEEDIEQAGNHLTGLSLKEAIIEAGLEKLPLHKLSQDKYLAYIEAHVEQGPSLDSEKLHLGVVTAITGIRTFRLKFRGQQNHAGTTPMTHRRDAGSALLGLAGVIEGAFSKIAGCTTVWTIGHIHLEPGMPNVIAGRAEMLLEFRDTDVKILDMLEAKLAALAKEKQEQSGVVILVEPVYPHVEPAEMNTTIQEYLIAAAAHHAPGKWVQMVSGAGHDAQILSSHLATGMLFVPSIGGISHDIAEDTAEEDIIRGCQTLATAVEALFRNHSARISHQ